MRRLLSAIYWASVALFCPEAALYELDKIMFENLIKTIRGEK
jgi:hypothetical protein